MTNWLTRLRAGLDKTTSRLSAGISQIFARRQIDPATLAELEELLIASDLGPKVAARLAQTLRNRPAPPGAHADAARAILASALAEILRPVAQPLSLPTAKPAVLLMVGVNGVGKTTTIAKLAHQARQRGGRPMLVAGDTFRAAAVEQLQRWGQKLDCPVIAGTPGADAAGLAFQALEQARAGGFDLLLIDTAGRLHNKSDLMAELGKLVRVLRKLDADAPHATLLVLDATTGQNAIAQVRAFQELVPLTGLVVTKLDGTARGGIVVALAEQFGLPIVAVGVGEQADDLQAFAADDFARALIGLEGSTAA